VKLEARSECLVAHPAPDAERLHGFEDIMDAEDLSPLLHGFQREGDASAETPVGGRFAG
jgi:hypothetical protein